MSFFSLPKNIGNTVFNASDFTAATDYITYEDAMSLNTAQTVSASKTFLANTNMTGIVNSADTYLEDLHIGGSTVIGDSPLDSLLIKCATTSIQGNVDISGIFSSTTLNALKTDFVDLSTNVTDHMANTVTLDGSQNITGVKTFANLNITGNTVIGDVRSDVLTVDSNSTFLNNVVIGDDNDTDILNVKADCYIGGTNFHVRSGLVETNGILENPIGNGMVMGFNRVTGSGSNTIANCGYGATGGLEILNYDTSNTYQNTAAHFQRDGSTDLYNDTRIGGNLDVSGSLTGVSKDMVGLTSVDDTADLDKPISTSCQSALDLKLDLLGGVINGDVSLNDMELQNIIITNDMTLQADTTIDWSNYKIPDGTLEKN
ncbi:MAG: hypothetical protein HOI47_32290, partial [Candidatus Scalindua sp.]|nr:hypothetical protein [Candidatus Scalindua sp.]